MRNAKLLVDQINGIIIEILKTGPVFLGSFKFRFKWQQFFLIPLFSQTLYSRSEKRLPNFPGSQLLSFPASLF
jgi:hypothetical protein